MLSALRCSVFAILVLVHSSAIADSIFWVDWTYGTIQSATLNGNDVKDVVVGLHYPSGVAIDAIAGKMYWSQASPTDKIQRANIDGTGTEDLVTDLPDPFGPALDIADGTMYWSEWGSHTIRRSNLDGSNIVNLVTDRSSTGVPTLDLHNGLMYWGNDGGGENRIERSNLDGSNVVTLTFVGSNHAVTPQLDLATSKMYWADGLANGHIWQSNLDGSGAISVISGLDTPLGLTLDLFNGKMYWGELNPLLKPSIGRLRRANFDGSDMEDIVADVGQVVSIAIYHVPEPDSVMLFATSVCAIVVICVLRI